MTVSTTQRKTTYTGTGANTALNTVFPFVGADDLEVVSRVTATGVETTLTSGVHYNVTGGDYATGTVTPIDGATDFPTTVTWTLKRVTDRTQATDYQENEDFPAESHEKALDKLTYLQQETAEDVDRALKIPVGESGTTTELPNVVDRASKSLGFDVSGNPVALAGTVSGDVTVSSFMETLLDDTTAAAGLTTLGALPISKGNKAARDAIVTPQEGHVFVRTDLHPGAIDVYETSAWVRRAGPFVGQIALWSGSVAVTGGYLDAVPGWALCDGATVNSFVTPDLKGNFVVGLDVGDADYDAIGDTGGEKTHTLTEAEMPAHEHSDFSDRSDISASGVQSVLVEGSGEGRSAGGSKGGGTAHENRPPFYTLAYIVFVDVA